MELGDDMNKRRMWDVKELRFRASLQFWTQKMKQTNKDQCARTEKNAHRMGEGAERG